MNRYNLFGVVTMALAAISWAPVSAKTLSEKDAVTFRNCKAMEAEAAFQNPSCRAVMRKLRVTKTDLVKMKSCESETSTTQNPDCAKMAEKHPDLARGHGMDEPAKTP